MKVNIRKMVPELVLQFQLVFSQNAFQQQLYDLESTEPVSKSKMKKQNRCLLLELYSNKSQLPSNAYWH